LLPFPAAARSQFVLDLPAGKQPVFTGGVILESPARPQDGGRWIVALRPGGPATVQLQDSAKRSVASAASPKVHQELSYHLSQRGTELQARLRIDGRESDFRQLEIDLPSGLKLVEARSGERQLPWRVVAGQGGSTASHAIVELGSERPIQKIDVSLLCWGPPVVGEPLELPMLLVDDAFWTSGKIDVAIDSELEPGELTPVDCVQTAVDSIVVHGICSGRHGGGPTGRATGQGFGENGYVARRRQSPRNVAGDRRGEC
jgi:hypothetical protein